MKEKLKYLIPVIIILCLVIPKPTSAAIFTGFFDYFVAAFEGVEEFTAPIAQLFILLGLSYIIGLGTLFISSTLLQLIIQHPEWLSITNNAVVRIGWSFTAGLTNMFFILIFVFIALAIILKIESFQAKKVLPKLLIMALLVNFSLIFVGATVDIANIFYRTIVPSGGNLVLDIVDVLAKGGSKTLKNIIDEVIFLAVSFIVPVIGPFMQLGFVINLVSTGFVGNVLLWIVQGVMLSMMSGILFTYALLFLSRIFVLQLLAMVAPVAFLCSVLPETKKYWDDWVKMVVDWNVFGVITLLFLVVGLQGLNSVIPPALLTDVVPTLLQGTGLSWIAVPPSIMYYFFLFVYLSTLLFFSKKYTPMMGDLIINQAKSLGSMVYTKGIKTFGKGAMAGIKHTRGRWKEISAARREQKGKEKFGTRLRMGVGSRLAEREGIVGKWGTRMMRGTTMETEEAKRVEKQVTQLKSTFGAKGEHLDDALKVGGARFKGPMKAALLQYAAETRGEAGIDKFKEKMKEEKYHESVKEIIKSSPHKVKDLVKNKRDLIDGKDTPEDIRNLIRNAMVRTVEDGNFETEEGEEGKKYYKDDDVRFLVDNDVLIGGKKASELVDSKEKKDREALATEAAHKKAIGALDPNDLKTLSYHTANTKEFRERAVRYRTDNNFFRKLSTVKGINLTKFQDVADETPEAFEETVRINPNFIQYAVTAGKGLMRPWDYKNMKIGTKAELSPIMETIQAGEEKERPLTPEKENEISQRREKLHEIETKRLAVGLIREEKEEKGKLEGEIGQMQANLIDITQKEWKETKSLLGEEDEKLKELVKKRAEEIRESKKKEFERLADFYGYEDPTKQSTKTFIRALSEDEARKQLIEERKAPLKKPIVPPVKKEEKAKQKQETVPLEEMKRATKEITEVPGVGVPKKMKESEYPVDLRENVKDIQENVRKVKKLRDKEKEELSTLKEAVKEMESIEREIKTLKEKKKSLENKMEEIEENKNLSPEEKLEQTNKVRGGRNKIIRNLDRRQGNRNETQNRWSKSKQELEKTQLKIKEIRPIIDEKIKTILKAKKLTKTKLWKKEREKESREELIKRLKEMPVTKEDEENYKKTRKSYLEKYLGEGKDILPGKEVEEYLPEWLKSVKKYKEHEEHEG